MRHDHAMDGQGWRRCHTRFEGCSYVTRSSCGQVGKRLSKQETHYHYETLEGRLHVMIARALIQPIVVCCLGVEMWIPVKKFDG